MRLDDGQGVVDENAQRATSWQMRAGGEVARWLVVAGVGLAITLLPHVIAGRNYLADGDELLYRAWSRDMVMHGSWSLVDATHPQSGPMMHPWLLFAPPARICRALGLGQDSLAMVWRSLAGLGIATGLYLTMRVAIKPGWVAASLAIFLMCDPGFLFGQPVGRGPLILASLVRGSSSFFDGEPYVMPHLRVVTPALALPFLLIHFALMLRARRSGERGAILGAGVSLGLLFPTYFYFWTTALSSAFLVLILDPSGRRVYARVLAIGLILGLPAILMGMSIKASTSPDWLLRTDKFVPIDRFSEWIIPTKVLTIWLATTPWVFLKRRDLSYLWCFVGAGMAGLNSQVLTGMQFENFHWMQAMGSSLSVLIACLCGTLIEQKRGRGWQLILAFAVIGQVGLGLYLRAREATTTVETQRWANLGNQLGTLPRAIPKGAIIAGDEQVTLLLAGASEVYPLSGRLVEYSALAQDSELDERLILNLFLMGNTRASAEALVLGPAGALSREAQATRNPTVAKAQQERRLQLIDSIYADPTALIAKYDVGYVFVKQGCQSKHVKPLGRLVEQGEGWTLWQIRPISLATTVHPS